MNRKLFLSLTIGILASALLAGTAFAAQLDTGQPDRDFPRQRRFGLRGEITAVDFSEGAFSLRTARGEVIELVTTESTMFRGEVDRLADLTPGMPAAVLALRQGQGSLLALQVLVHPELDRVKRTAGLVSAIDPGGVAFTIETPDLGEITFLVDEQTRYRGAAESFADLTLGQAVIVLSASLENGSVKAVVIYMPFRPPIRRFAGEVAGIDLGQGTFKMVTRSNEPITIDTTQETEFFSRDGIDSLEDLEAGMKVFVTAAPQVGGGLLGKRVLVLPAGDGTDNTE